MNTIGAGTDVPAIRPAIAAYPTSVTARLARAHSMRPTLSRPPTLRPGFTRVTGCAIDAGSAPRDHALPMGRPITVRR